MVSAATPSFWTRWRWREILASGTNLGCRHLIERQPELVHAYETANTRFVTDLDTVDDVEQLARRTGWRLELPALEAAH